MTPRKVKMIFDTLLDATPNPKTELNFSSNFELLVAVILSAQATDISVNKATSNLFKNWNTPEKILELGEAGLLDIIRSIGLAPSKAKNIISTCKMLIVNHESMVPDSGQYLEALPGVGRKTANVILNTAFNKPTIAFDTHIFRLANRIGLVKDNTVKGVELGLLKIVPKKHLMNAHHLMILHGRYVCKARNPDCKNCVIYKFCEFNGDKVS